MRIRVKYGVLSCALALFGGAVLFLLFHFDLVPPAPSYIVDGEVNVGEATRHWAGVIAAQGPKQGYATMVAEALAEPPDMRHLLAHTFGSALFSAGGVAYARYCGIDFIYGCYHQMVGLSVAENGAEIIDVLVQECEMSHYTADCAHGLGHALLWLQGYTSEKLARALPECERLYTKDIDKSFCADGIFMEFNIREILSPESIISARPFEETSALEPCLKVPERFQHECVFELPSWWALSYESRGTEEAQKYATLGKLCRTMPEQGGLQAVCFMALGFPVAYASASDRAHAITLCAAASTQAKEKDLCLLETARRYVEMGLKPESICDTYSFVGEKEKVCTEFIGTTRNVAFNRVVEYWNKAAP